MKKIAKIIDSFDEEINEVKKTKLEELKKLKENIKLSKRCLQQLRLLVREEGFYSEKEEITFFKHQKPYVLGKLNFYLKISTSLLEYPSVCNTKKRNYINEELNKLDSNICKHLEFVKYYRLGENKLDRIYFLRGNNQLDLFMNNNYHCHDPEFSSSHDYLVSRIITHDLLTRYYANELQCLEIMKSCINPIEVKPESFGDLSWRGTKTEFIELAHALIASRSIDNGISGIKNTIEVFAAIFNIDLGNHYKTFTQIKDRQKDLAKFLDKLKISLIKKIESVD